MNLQPNRGGEMNEKTLKENKKLRNLAYEIAKDGQNWKKQYEKLSTLFCSPKMRSVLLLSL